MSGPASPAAGRGRNSPAVRSLAVLAVFVAALLVGRLSRAETDEIALVWPAAGVGVLWLAGSRNRPQLVVDAVLLATATVAVNLATGLEPVSSVVFGPVNVLHAVTGLLVMRRLWPDGDPRLCVPRDVLRTLLVGAAAALASGPASALLSWWLLGADLAQSTLVFFLRNGGTTFAVLVIALGLSSPYRLRDLVARERAAETLLALTAAAALSVFVFVVPSDLPIVFLVLALPVWIGMRLGVARTAALGGVMAAASVWLTVHGRGALSFVEPELVRAVLVQVFVVLLLLVGMVLATQQQTLADAADALRASEARLRDTIDSAMVGSALLDLGPGVEDDPCWRLRQANPASRGLLRTPVGDLDWRPLLAPEDRDRIRGVLAGLRDGRDRSWRGEVCHRLPAGGELWAEVHLSRLPSVAGHDSAVVQLLDVTARKQMEQRLSHLALHDHLTGLPNRLLLLDRIEQELSTAARTSSTVALIFLDLDHFKTINDSLGHDVGDAVLRVTADRLRSALRAGDTVARIGGDEFVVCCGDMADEYAAMAMAERLTEVVSPPVVLADRTLSVGVSAGVTVSRPGDDAGTLLRQSDAAMYAAKRSGRGRVAPFDDELHARAHRQLALTEDLARALLEDRFVVHYQPILDLRSRSVVAVEALVRWDDPEHGLRTPVGWLDVIEDSELMVELGEWVLRRACADAADLAARHRPVRVHVNVSGRQLAQAGLVEQVQLSLRDSRLRPDLLVLELTETYLMNTHSSLLNGLEQLRLIGVQLSVDDFGTGYSSLSQLVQLPVDSLKIDRAFVAGVPADARSVAVVRGILAMARSLGLDVVAEGVETDVQADLLQTWWCPSAQGNLWSRPLPVERIGALLDQVPVLDDLDLMAPPRVELHLDRAADAASGLVSEQRGGTTSGDRPEGP
jgi:diguanylate cyclase (GGDEF)-like protein/PAS domain S-box-containing protein